MGRVRKGLKLDHSKGILVILPATFFLNWKIKILLTNYFSGNKNYRFSPFNYPKTPIRVDRDQGNSI